MHAIIGLFENHQDSLFSEYESLVLANISLVMSEQKSNNSSEQALSESLLEANNSEITDKQAQSLTASSTLSKALKKEINGPKGLEPTRYGDWESKGRCYDF